MLLLNAGSSERWSLCLADFMLVSLHAMHKRGGTTAWAYVITERLHMTSFEA